MVPLKASVKGQISLHPTSPTFRMLTSASTSVLHITGLGSDLGPQTIDRVLLINKGHRGLVSPTLSGSRLPEAHTLRSRFLSASSAPGIFYLSSGSLNQLCNSASESSHPQGPQATAPEPNR